MIRYTELVAQLPWMSQDHTIAEALVMLCKLVSDASFPQISQPAVLLHGTDFVPLVAETLGGLAEDTISSLSSISQAIAG
jgi:hypothetical protein